MLPFDKDDILRRVRAGEKLSREEEVFYLVEVRGFTDADARR